MESPNPVVILKEHITCRCNSRQHDLVFEYDSDIGLMIYVQLYQWKGLWTRLKEAVRYVLGAEGTCRWSDTHVQYDDIEKIKKLLELAEKK